MPHIIIEYSSNIAEGFVSNLFPEILDQFASIPEGKFDISQCKIRAISFDNYTAGKSPSKTIPFIHTTVKIMEGRAVEVKKELSDKIFNLTRESFALEHNELFKKYDITVDIVEMSKDLYRKCNGS